MYESPNTAQPSTQPKLLESQNTLATSSTSGKQEASWVSLAIIECSLRTSLSLWHQSLDSPARMSLSSGDLNNKQHKKKSSGLSRTPQYLSNQTPQGNLSLRSMPLKSERVPSFTNTILQPRDRMAQTNLDHGDQWDFIPRNSPPLSKTNPSTTANS